MGNLKTKWFLRLGVIALVAWELATAPAGTITIEKHLAVFVVVGLGTWLFSLATVFFQVGRIGMRSILNEFFGSSAKENEQLRKEQE
jgi:hypothetical protein